MKALRASSLALVLLAAVMLVPSAGAAKPKYQVYASCANSKPFKASNRCRYDSRRAFRATFVFKSNVGRRVLKACFRVYGAKPLGGGHACAKLPATRYKAYPFKITGVRQPFGVKVTWLVKRRGGGFQRVGASFMRVRT